MGQELNRVFVEQPTTIFTIMSALSVKHGAINLGQGFPDSNGPDDIRDIAARALLDGPNQYPPSQGIPELRMAVAEHNRRFYGIELDWESEVIVTSGATEALAACFLAMLNRGDEVILIEPAYDSYAPVVTAAGGVPVYVQLEPPDWHIREEQLRDAFSDKTKLVVINSPMNPTGKVFDQSELSLLAELVNQHDTYVVCDEVYEHLVFDNLQHIPLMSLPGMSERCVRIGSAGKTFSLTGWKVGYISAKKQLADVIAKTHQFLTFTTVPALQKAVAAGLGKTDEYFQRLQTEMQSQRDFLNTGLGDIGFATLQCSGTYFITADFSSLNYDGSDVEFCRYITIEAGVSAIPVSVFYNTSSTSVPEKLIRFCFCKDRESLSMALDRLREFFK